MKSTTTTANKVRRDIYNRLAEFYEEYHHQKQLVPCPFGNSGNWFDIELDKIEQRIKKQFFDKYGRCKGLCMGLGLTPGGLIGLNSFCPCHVYPDDAFKRLKNWLKENK